MFNFQQIGFIDTFELAASLRPRMGLFKDAGDGRREALIRWPDDAVAEVPRWLRLKEAAKWTELSNAVARVERIGTALVGPVERGRIFFEMLDPGTATPWRAEDGAYFREYWRLHLAIRTNPGCMMFAGTEAVNLLPGQIMRVATSVKASAVNGGEWPRIHLILDFRLKPRDPATQE